MAGTGKKKNAKNKNKAGNHYRSVKAEAPAQNPVESPEEETAAKKEAAPEYLAEVSEAEGAYDEDPAEAYGDGEEGAYDEDTAEEYAAEAYSDGVDRVYDEDTAEAYSDGGDGAYDEYAAEEYGDGEGGAYDEDTVEEYGDGGDGAYDEDTAEAYSDDENGAYDEDTAEAYSDGEDGAYDEYAAEEYDDGVDRAYDEDTAEAYSDGEDGTYDGYAAEEYAADGYADGADYGAYDDGYEAGPYDAYGSEDTGAGYGPDEAYDGYAEEAGYETYDEYGEPCTDEPAPVEDKGRKKAVFAACAALFVLLLLGTGAFVYYKLPYWCVKETVTVEAGEPCPPVAEFLNWRADKAYFVTDIDEAAKYEHVNDHEIVIHLYHRDVTAVLHVEDTNPPALVAQDKVIMLGDVFEVQDLVESVSDVTDCVLAYKEEPKIEEGGVYEIALTATDEGGNVTEALARLEVLVDITPPVMEGVAEITITVGDSVSYKKDITVIDDYDPTVRLEVDNSQVDIDTPGDYPVVYRATDASGNTTEIATVLHVVERVSNIQVGASDVPVTEEAVNAAADKVLASITDPSMSQYEVLKAIYNWCHNQIAYQNGTPKSSWVEGAYCGIVQRRGDCYAYAMSAKCLLTRAGIVNMDIERIPYGNGMHFWNLVDIGEGWRHFDTCRRADGSTFFYLTDAELMAYSDKHTAPDYPNGTHYYDRSLYPEIP